MNEMNFFYQDVSLQNQCVVLRPLAFADVDALLPIAVEPELWQMGVTQIQNRQDLVAYVQEALQERAKQTSYAFVIVDAKSQQVVGCTRLYEMSFEHKCASIGWTWLAQAARGTRINHAAKFELLRLVFETLAFHRVQFYVDAMNVRSRRAIAKLGATEEGILRNHMITYTGRVRDTVIGSIVHTEWPAIKNSIFSDMA